MGSSLDTNPPNADRHITAGGSDWLWAVFVVMLLSDLIMIFWAFSRPRGTRLFHQIAVIVLTTATIAYFSMASDLGATPVRPEFSRGNTGTRQIWYVRYIQWFITLPLLLLELLLATGLSISDIFTTLFMAWVFVICGLVGALVATVYKWGYFVFGVMALLYIWYVLLGHGPRSTFASGGVGRSGYLRSAGYLSFLLMLYPIAWGLSEGGNVLSPTHEMIFYGILDLLAGPVFLFFFLWSLRSVDYGAFGLLSTKHTDASYGSGTGGYGHGGAGTASGMTHKDGAAHTNRAGTGSGAPLGGAGTAGHGTTATGGGVNGAHAAV
ncbi:family A G protein-coupled receptor-like protein [Polyporus arcularius HHB13444]|uniref:Family A G protein-coupled receptor-like protein n=1 Tax=Polyporus arcularius HHB13444 TaxID=1314778 RepID=A0A5C3PUQ2_9APHY|nr:family A G protein-coupled receptor-like protein [Polyporus arcularius HHB13444]